VFPVEIQFSLILIKVGSINIDELVKTVHELHHFIAENETVAFNSRMNQAAFSIVERGCDLKRPSRPRHGYTAHHGI